MSIPDAGLLLAGFVLGHSAWSVSDVRETLVPLAIIERQGNRELVRIEAQTQAEAVLKGKSLYPEWTKTSDAWAFAREGLMPDGDSKVDVFVIDFWTKGMSKPATVIQRFEPFARRGQFRIIGDPEIVLDGTIQVGDNVKQAVLRLGEGIGQHPKAASLWKTWRGH